MLADPTKVAITMGLPDHIDFEKNLAIPGDPYEDPVFVDENGEEITADEAAAESEEAHGAEGENEIVDVQNEALLAEMHKQSVNITPDLAHELIMSKHAEIMIFLEDIAKLKWLNENEKRIVGEITRFIQLLKNRQELVKNVHEADIIQSIDVMIHKLTVQLDEHTFNAHAMVNRAESIYHHMKENKKLDRMLD